MHARASLDVDSTDRATRSRRTSDAIETTTERRVDTNTDLDLDRSIDCAPSTLIDLID